MAPDTPESVHENRTNWKGWLVQLTVTLAPIKTLGGGMGGMLLLLGYYLDHPAKNTPFLPHQLHGEAISNKGISTP